VYRQFHHPVQKQALGHRIGEELVHRSLGSSVGSVAHNVVCDHPAHSWLECGGAITNPPPKEKPINVTGSRRKKYAGHRVAHLGHHAVVADPATEAVQFKLDADVRVYVVIADWKQERRGSSRS